MLRLPGQRKRGPERSVENWQRAHEYMNHRVVDIAGKR